MSNNIIDKDEYGHKVVRALLDYDSCPTKMKTDGTFWPFCLVLAEEVISSTKNVPLDQHTIQIILQGFIKSLINRTENIGRQAILLEKHIYEQQNEKEVSYDKFRTKYVGNSKELSDFLLIYCELNRVINSISYDFMKNCLNMIFRLAGDWKGLEKVFGDRFIDNKLEEIVVTEGETHSGHNVVIKMQFCNGFALAYKPRDLRFEHELTSALNYYANHADNVNIRGWILPKYICKDGYGWVEWLNQVEVETADEVRLFYLRAGFLIAFSTFFITTDLHSGNIIAHSSSPVPIDLEAALSHTKRYLDNSRTVSQELLWNSTSTNLLPSWTWKGADMAGVDISGLGGLEEQYCSLSLYQYDPVSGEYKQGGITLHPDKNVLFLRGIKQKPYKYKDLIVEGFKQGAFSVKNDKNFFFHVISKIKELPARYINRATAGYHYAIMCSLHPSYLMDLNKRKSFIDQCMLETSTSNNFLKESEIDSCMECDVPRFLTAPNKLSASDEITDLNYNLDEEFYKSGTETAIDFFLAYDSAREEFETKLINGTLSALEIAYDQSHQSRLRYEKQEVLNNTHIKVDKVQEALHELCKYLDNYVRIECERGYDWFGFKTSVADLMEYTVLGDDLYSGVSGIIYAIGALHQANIFQFHDINNLVSGYIDELIKELTIGTTKVGGAYLGLASTLLPLISIASRTHRQQLEDLLKAAHRKISDNLGQRPDMSPYWGTDIFGGLSGLISVASNIYSATGDDSWLSLAERIFDDLRKETIYIDDYALFPQNKAVSAHGSGCLTGLSHGQIGIAVALADLFKVTKDKNINKLVGETIDHLIRWEIDQYDELCHNWPDYRVRARFAQEGATLITHGSPGIYICLQRLSNLGFDRARSFIEVRPFGEAVTHITKAAITPVSECVGNGTFGALVAYSRIQSNELASHVSELTSWAHVCEYINLNALSTRIRISDVPGFWVGKAGIAIVYAEMLGLLDKSIPILPCDFIENHPVGMQNYLQSKE